MALRRQATVAAAAIAAAVLAALGSGCGKTVGPLGGGGASSGPARSVIAAGLPFVATKNTTRVAGSDPVADAAGVAAAVFPSASAATHPQAIALVDGGSWQTALAAAALMSPPIRAPLLFGAGTSLPGPTRNALARLAPTGSSAAGGAQLIRVGSVARPAGLRSTAIAAPTPFAAAAAIDRFVSAARGRTGSSVIVVSAVDPGFAMPAAAWAAKTGDPILFVTHDTVPPETRDAIARRPQAHIYVLGPVSAVSDRVLTQLSGLGTVRRVAAADPVSNAIAFARYVDGAFGWGVVNPGHGLVLASSGRPLDAAAAAPLSASGTYGPLLLIDNAGQMPDLLRQYLLDIQPGYAQDPTRGVYNHAWLVGDENAISSPVQSQLDALLEITPVSAAKGP